MSAAQERLTCRDRSAWGPCARTCPTCGIGKAPRPALGTRNDARLSLPEKDPQTSLSSPLPAKKKKKKGGGKKSPSPLPAASASQARAPGSCRGPARLRDPPGDAGSGPDPGAAWSRTPVTWIFRSSGGSHPFLLSLRGATRTREVL